MPTATKTAVRDARDQVAPTLQKAQETLTDTVLPAVVSALAVAKEKGAELLDSDTALEAKRRSAAVVRAARGDTVIATTGRRWRFGLGMLAAGAGIGYGIAFVLKKLATPVESYQHTLSPVPSGTVTGDTGFGTGAAPAGTPTQDIDLEAGAPSTS